MSNQELATSFWNDVSERSVQEAVQELYGKVDTLDDLEEMIPDLVEEAKQRDIDLVKFLQDLDEIMTEIEDASGASNGSDELPSDSGDEAGQPQDEDESAPARDADAEGGNTNQSDQ
jgi:hypothetical protein